MHDIIIWEIEDWFSNIFLLSASYWFQRTSNEAQFQRAADKIRTALRWPLRNLWKVNKQANLECHLSWRPSGGGKYGRNILHGPFTARRSANIERTMTAHQSWKIFGESKKANVRVIWKCWMRSVGARDCSKSTGAVLQISSTFYGRINLVDVQGGFKISVTSYRWFGL